jgi:acyl carrier protein
MHFGESVREVVSKSCGKDLRAARSRTELPGIDSPEVQRRLVANLERSFDIALSPEDVAHLTTLRAVLQCVRLRRWEREMALHGTATPVIAAAASTPTMRDRFVRYTPPATPVPTPVEAASFAIRKS